MAYFVTSVTGKTLILTYQLTLKTGVGLSQFPMANINKLLTLLALVHETADRAYVRPSVLSFERSRGV